MALEDLCNLVETLRQKSQKFGHLLSQSEALTRYVLIDPILRSLGWDTENPELIRPEYSPGQGKADYVLFENNQPLAFIEAKSLGQSLQQGIIQSINYTIQSGTKYFIITDGLKWEIYETHKPVPLPQKRTADFDIAKGDVKEAVLHLLALWKFGSLNPSPLVVQNIPPVLPSNASIGTAISSIPSHGSSGAAMPTQSTIALASFAVKLGEQPPKKLVDPNGVEHSVKAWRDILLLVVDWLLQQGLLTTNDCPVQLPNASRYLISTTPKHKSGDDFSARGQVQSVYVETKADARKLVHDASFLLQKYGKGRDFSILT
jgi:hypothetical protein